jgi:hypothetical protein
VGTDKEAKHAKQSEHWLNKLLPTATQLYWKRKMKNSRKLVMRTRQNLLQSI